MKFGGQIVEDIEKQMVRKLVRTVRSLGSAWRQRLLQPQPGSCHRILGKEPNQQLLPLLNRKDRVAPTLTLMLEITGGNKAKMGGAQKWCSPTGSVDASWIITREIGELDDNWRREKS